MPTKERKKIVTEPTNSFSEETDTSGITPRSVSLSFTFQGELDTAQGEWVFLIIYNEQILLEMKWEGECRESENLLLPVNLNDEYSQALVADNPLIFLLRNIIGKAVKDSDLLLSTDNKAGGTVDLLPLLLGEQCINCKVPLVCITTGEYIGCVVDVRIATAGVIECNNKIPVQVTLISAHCLPPVKEGTVYLGAIGLKELTKSSSINFGMSISSSESTKCLWATAGSIGYAGYSTVNVTSEDLFLPYDIESQISDKCRVSYWNAMKRILVDSDLFRERLSNPFLIEIAGCPKLGKFEARGRYMGFVDAGVLLEPGQYSVATCCALKRYNEADSSEKGGPLLDLPPTSAKVSARNTTDIICDEYDHNSYIIIRFDLHEPLVPKMSLISLFESTGFPFSNEVSAPIENMRLEPVFKDTRIDVRCIRKEEGALDVHNELRSLSCRGTVRMNQSIKQTAANRLLMRVRSLIKQFPPGECTTSEWQDIVTSQHAAIRRAVTTSFAPQPPSTKVSSRFKAAKLNRQSGTSNKYLEDNLNVLSNDLKHLLLKTLRCLENEKDTEAKIYISQALTSQPKNKYLLWIYGAQEFDKGQDANRAAAAAFQIAVKGDHADSAMKAIGWTALHVLYHYNHNIYAAFVASKKMRKSYELQKDWKMTLKRWFDASGEEEMLWIPGSICFDNPMLIASGFFLCLRCYKFTELILRCLDSNCATRGSRLNLKTKINPDIYYIRATSFLLRRQYDKAMEMTELGIKRFGPSSIMLQIRASCLVCVRGWDEQCESAFNDAENSGADPCPVLLLKAALGSIKTNVRISLQQAARAHKIAPNAYSALVLGRIYGKDGQEDLAKRWTAASVKMEPDFADGWAYLALLKLLEKDTNQARAMLRTAKQVGTISSDIWHELKDAMKIVHMEALPDVLVDNLCRCDNY